MTAFSCLEWINYSFTRVCVCVCVLREIESKGSMVVCFKWD